MFIFDLLVLSVFIDVLISKPLFDNPEYNLGVFSILECIYEAECFRETKILSLFSTLSSQPDKWLFLTGKQSLTLSDYNL